MPQPERRLRTRTRTAVEERPRTAPLWRVLLHDDDVNSMDHVVRALQAVFRFGLADARAVMQEAHCTGVALCRIEPRAAAQRHRDGLRSFGLTASIEPDAR